ncbi:MAG: GspH/FimT family pseudopilin [Betaproteobacteria bacterium]
MLISRHSSPGFSMVELLIGIAIVSVLLAVGLPQFSTYLQNSQIRSGSESMLAGLQAARTEAVRRNTSMRFQLTSSVDSTCALSTTGKSWVVSQRDPSGLCDVAPTADGAVADPANPEIRQKRSGAESSTNLVVVADQSAIVFNSLGQQTPAATVNLNLSNPTGGDCKTSTGSEPMRCMRIVVSPGGQIRMCDPAVPVSVPPDNRSC